MPNGYIGGFVPKGSSEIGKPGLETEVSIPVHTYVWIGIVGTISIAILMLIVWLFQLHTYLKSAPPRCHNIGRWWSQFPVVCWLVALWWPRFRVWWPINLAVIGLWWAFVPAAPTLYRFVIEQMSKWLPPPTSQWDPRDGMWWPWSKVAHSGDGPRSRGRVQGNIDFSLEDDE